MLKRGGLLLWLILACLPAAPAAGLERVAEPGRARTLAALAASRASSAIRPLKSLVPRRLVPRNSAAPKDAPAAFSQLQAGASSRIAPNASGEARSLDASRPFDDPAPRKGGVSGGDGPTDGSGPGGDGDSGGAADDGGGADYPRRKIQALGKTFDEVALRPNVPVESQIVAAWDAMQAGDHVHLAVYEFKSDPILAAIRRALLRGVEVHMVIDYSQVFPDPDPRFANKPARPSQQITSLLEEVNQPDVGGRLHVKVLRGLGRFGINHNKFAVFAGKLAEWGSYNWSVTAELDHYENANFSTKQTTIDFFTAYWSYLDSVAQDATLTSKPSDYKWPVQFSELPPMPEALANPPAEVSYNKKIKLPEHVASPSMTKGRAVEDYDVSAIDATEKGQTIDVNVFALESVKFVKALVAAKGRGVKVRVIMDQGQAYSSNFGPYAKYLAYHGIDVRTRAGPDPNSKYPQAQKDHHKYVIFNDSLLRNGSGNPTKQSSIANFENVHYTDDAGVIAPFRFAFDHIWEISKPFPAPEAEPKLPSDDELTAATFQSPDPRAEGKKAFPGPNPGIKAKMIDYKGKQYPTIAVRPDTDIETLLVNMIGSAEYEINLSAYEFDLDSLLDAIRAAKKRNPSLKLRIVLDHDHVYTSGLNRLGRPAMPSAQIQTLIKEFYDSVRVHKPHYGGIGHNKILTTDGIDLDTNEDREGLSETGSLNYSKASMHNHFENVLFSDDAADLKDLKAYQQYLWDNAEPVDLQKLNAILNRPASAARDENKRKKPGPDSAPNPFGEEEAPEYYDHPGATGPDRIDPELEPSHRRAAPDPYDHEAGPDHSTYLAHSLHGQPPPPASTAPGVDVNGTQLRRRYFSPNGGIKQAWLSAIKAARISITAPLFALYDKDIAGALVAAKQAGLRVRVLQDESQSHAKYAKINGRPIGQYLAENGIEYKNIAGPNLPGDPAYIAQLEKNHWKALLVDVEVRLAEIGQGAVRDRAKAAIAARNAQKAKAAFVTGSYNPTGKADQANEENEFITTDPKILDVAIDIVERMWDWGWDPKPSASDDSGPPQSGPAGDPVKGPLVGAGA